MKQKKEKSGSIKVEPTVLENVKQYCKSSGIKVGYFATEALLEKLGNEKRKFIHEKTLNHHFRL
jgi:hypothetical protein